MHQAVEMGAFGLGLLDRVADHDEGTGQNLELVGLATHRLHAALDVGV
jgi:hypothetical protein